VNGSDPINRYLINSPMLPGMEKNGDGSLTLSRDASLLAKDGSAFDPAAGRGNLAAAGDRGRAVIEL